MRHRAVRSTLHLSVTLTHSTGGYYYTADESWYGYFWRPAAQATIEFGSLSLGHAGTPCSSHPRYSVLTPFQALRAHPIPGTSCHPIPGALCSSLPRCSVLTPSQVLHCHPIRGTPCSPLIRSTPCSSNPWYFVLYHPLYSVLILPRDSVLTHPGTLCSCILGALRKCE